MQLTGKPKFTLKITATQLKAICVAADNIESSIGVEDEDFNKEAKWIVKNIDRFLKANGIELEYADK